MLTSPDPQWGRFMRGEVLHYDEAQGFGFITGADGNRYTFRREDVRRSFPVSRGAAVEFRESGNQARDVSSVDQEAPRASAASPPIPVAAPASRPFGRNAAGGSVGEGAGGEQLPSTGLWDYFWNGFTANYANFRTRARRKEYWGFVLFFYLGLIALAFVGVAIDFALGNMSPGNEFPAATIGISVLVGLAGIVPSIAVMVRRQHDIGLSGWFFLLVFVPYVGYLILLVFALIPSQKRENKWGPVPVGVRVPTPYLSDP